VCLKCDREALIMRRPRHPRGCRAIGKKNNGLNYTDNGLKVQIETFILDFFLSHLADCRV
jgi:hypothetical protein